MKIRKESQALKAVIDGYNLLPVYSYVPPTSHDELNNQGCYYVQQCIDTQYLDPRYYVAETNYYLPVIGYRVARAFNWTESKVNSMTYIDF